MKAKDEPPTPSLAEHTLTTSTDIKSDHVTKGALSPPVSDKTPEIPKIAISNSNKQSVDQQRHDRPIIKSPDTVPGDSRSFASTKQPSSGSNGLSDAAAPSMVQPITGESVHSANDDSSIVNDSEEDSIKQEEEKTGETSNTVENIGISEKKQGKYLAYIKSTLD